MEIWLTSLGVSSVVTGIAGLIGKYYFGRLEFKYQKGFERLELAYQKDLERLEFKFQTQYSALHAKRCDIVEDLFAKANALWRATGDYLHRERALKPIKDGAEAKRREMQIVKNLLDAMRDFKQGYQDKEVWFPEEICKEFYELNRLMDRAVAQQAKAEFPEIIGQETFDQGFTESQEAYAYCDEVVRPAIRGHFRELLGVK